MVHLCARIWSGKLLNHAVLVLRQNAFINTCGRELFSSKYSVVLGTCSRSLFSKQLIVSKLTFYRRNTLHNRRNICIWKSYASICLAWPAHRNTNKKLSLKYLTHFWATKHYVKIIEWFNISSSHYELLKDFYHAYKNPKASWKLELSMVVKIYGF